MARVDGVLFAWGDAAGSAPPIKLANVAPATISACIVGTVDWPILALAAAPGLLVALAGEATILRPQGSDPAVALRGGRMVLLGFGLFVLGPALVLAVEAVTRGNPLLVVGLVVAFGPAVAFPIWFWRRTRPKE